MFENDLKRFFLPYAWQKIGWIMALSGVIALFIRFGLGVKPGFLDIKVFAIYSSIFESQYFTLVGNNVSEEIGLLLLLAGLFLISFSFEKNENEHVWKIRLKAIFIAIMLNCILLFAATLFVFGWGFLAVMSANLFSVLVFYNFIFRYLIFSKRKKKG